MSAEGFIFLFFLYSLVFLFISFSSFYVPRISIPLALFVVISTLLSIAQAYYIDLPQGGSDARTFELYSYALSIEGLEYVISNYTGPSSYFMSWFHSVIYALVGREPLVIQAISMVLTLISIFLVYRIVLEVWQDQEVAVRACWFAALFPVAVLHSALTMREAYVAFLFLLYIYFAVRWSITGSFFNLAAAILVLMASSFFHGAIPLAGFGILLYLVWRPTAKGDVKASKLDFFRGLPAIIFFALLISMFLQGAIDLPKLGGVEVYSESGAATDRILSRVSDARGGAAHPTWTLVNSPSDALYKAPVRFSYFLFSPFPWDIRSPAHLIGLVDSFLYIFLFFCIWFLRDEIKNNPSARIILLSCFVMIVVFSFGTTNFGTGIRHRAKFVFAIIVLAAPAISFVGRKMLPASMRRSSII